MPSGAFSSAQLVSNPGDWIPLIRTKLAADRAKRLPKDEALAFCYGMLNTVSRSFAVVIQQLPVELRDAVCVFYLVLRALDTIEDDMALSDDRKLPLLESFHEIVGDSTFSMEDCGSGYYKDLMVDLPKVSEVFTKLNDEYRAVIKDITKRMGDGMSEFIQKEVVTVKDYDLYCHYVAGLVGVGLSDLFVASGLERKAFLTTHGLSNSMGLFLQKTNIIRDYLEDIMEEPAPRMFWPREIWSLYARRLEDFKEEKYHGEAVECLNHMVLNALSHVPDCLSYMSKLENDSVFRFCAIPQIMAMITLAMCYDNVVVFKGVVKMRRGLTARVLVNTRSFDHVLDYFFTWANEISRKAEVAKKRGDRTAEEVIAKSSAIQDECRKYGYVEKEGKRSYLYLVLWLFALFYFVSVFQGGLGTKMFHIGTDNISQQAAATLVLVATSLYTLW